MDVKRRIAVPVADTRFHGIVRAVPAIMPG
jgi:hypothetical protein